MTTKLIAATLAVATLALIATPSEARRGNSSSAVTQFCGDRYCTSGTEGVRTRQARPRRAAGSRRLAGAHREGSSYRATRATRSTAISRARAGGSRVAARIMPHPPGCPSRAFCGCGASIEVFGRSIRELWLAANWFRFPRTSPAPGMVAVRRHHVYVIREVLGGGRVLAYDANSGGHKTRIHVRSLAGYAVVNPHAGRRYAAAR